MFVFSYLLFTLAESTILKWSGTFALITLGLGLSKSQGTTIDKKTTSAIHGFYNYALYLAETLIFIAVGIFIGYEVEEHWGDIFHYSDLGLLVAFFLFTIIARFIAIGIFYYPLSKLGYGLDWKKYVLLSYGGLRGSHSLILALVVDEG
jgi:NhaP-type Na+/H+ or K+/H+ antiporter